MFTIDEELLERTDATFADMRIVDADGREAPFLVRAARDRRKVVTEHDIAVETLDFELLPDNRRFSGTDASPAHAMHSGAA